MSSFQDTVLNYGETNNGKAKKPDAKVWMNFVFTVKVKNEEGVLEDVTVTIAGVGLDTLDDAKVGRANTPYNQQQAAKNAVRAALVAKAMALEPGGTLILDPSKIQTQLRQVGTKEEISVETDANPFMIEI